MTAPHLLPGHIVAGKYTVRGELGRGPVSVTYAAMTAPNREVTLRIYDPSIPSVTKSIDRLRSMCAATSTLSPRSIVPIVDVGVDLELGAPYSATLQVTAPSLAQLVELCPLDSQELPAFVLSLARAVDALHSAGIAHLGLSPANVFVGPAPERFVQLTDAGVRGIFSGSASGRALAWFAPEQVDRASASGPPADIFAAALVAFYALTGHPLLRTAVEPVIDQRAWLDEIASRPMATARARELGIELPPPVDEVFRRAMALAPGERFATAGQFAAELAKAIAPGAASELAENGGFPSPPKTPPPFPMRDASPTIPDPLPVTPSLDSAFALDNAPPLFHSAPAVEVARPVLDDPPNLEPVIMRLRRSPLLLAGVLGVAFLVLTTTLAVSLGHRRKATPVASAGMLPGESTPPTAALAATPTVATVESTPPVATVESTPPVATVESTPPVASVASKGSTRSEPSRALEDGRGELIIECEPVSCAAIAVDGKLVSRRGRVVVRAGVHAIGVSRPGYAGGWKRLEVPAGEQTVVRFTLVPMAPSPKKACGKFLDRCD